MHPINRNIGTADQNKQAGDQRSAGRKREWKIEKATTSSLSPRSSLLPFFTALSISEYSIAEEHSGPRRDRTDILHMFADILINKKIII